MGGLGFIMKYLFLDYRAWLQGIVEDKMGDEKPQRMYSPIEVAQILELVTSAAFTVYQASSCKDHGCSNQLNPDPLLELESILMSEGAHDYINAINSAKNLVNDSNKASKEYHDMCWEYNKKTG
ncbi:hypothetical protein ACFL96_09385 [Thermoproteota archaeon]